MLSPLTLLAAPLVIAVSDRGDDAGPGSPARPFRTLERAVRALRERAPGRPAEVRLRGFFTLDHELDLGGEASNVTFRGPATLSGAWALRDWTRDGDAWRARVPAGARFRQLWIGERRVPRPTLPRGGGYYTFAGWANDADAKRPWNEGSTAMRFRPGDLKPSFVGAEIVAHHFWVTSRLPIASVDGDTVTFDRKSVFKLADDYTGGAAPYRVENVAEAQQRGEWILRDGAVRFMGDRPATAYAPHLPTLLRIKGATNVRLEGLEFRHTEWDLPPGFAGDGQAAVSVPGAVVLDGTQDAAVEGCRFANLGGYALELVGSVKGNRVARCRMADLGGGGVKIGPGTDATTLEDSTIEGGGRLFASAVGVWIGDSGHNVLAHNRIRDLFYTGISVGWTWGYGPSHAVENRIEANDIADLGQGELSDMGGIYTLGVSPGTVLRGNRIRNVRSRGYGGWGIYLDEGTSDALVEGNAVDGTETGGFHIHYGGDDVVRGNVFAHARLEGQLIRQRDDKQGAIRFERNLVVADPGEAPLVVPNWLRRAVTMTGNLYAVPPVALPFGDDGTGRFVTVRLGSDGLPSRAWAAANGFPLPDLRGVGPR